jgi:hypothetical protein
LNESVVPVAVWRRTTPECTERYVVTDALAVVLVEQRPELVAAAHFA